MDLTEIGQQFGLTPEQTKAAFDALAPVVAAGVQRNGNAGGGLGDIIDSMARNQSGGSDALTKHGNDVLGEIFKTKDVSRGVADQVSASTGIGSAVLKKMLPIIASIVMAQIARQMAGGAGASTGGGGLGDILGQILGGGAGQQPQPNTGSGGLGDILGQILGGAAGGAAPSQGGGLGDILGQILGGSGGTQATSAGGNLLDSVEKALRNR
jgi:hypothetical protein